MKITISELGYYHPSNANWSYRVHLVIDDHGACLYRETFGGDERMRRVAEEAGHTVEKLYPMHGGSSALYKWAQVGHMPDIESYDPVHGNKSVI